MINYLHLLEQAIPRLTHEQLVLLWQLARSMQWKVEKQIFRTDLISEATGDYVANRLLLHHALSDEPLSKKSFEYLLKDTAIIAGKTAAINNNPTHPGADVVIGNERFSLKTEGGKRIRDHVIAISKFSEAKGIGATEVKSDANKLAIKTANKFQAHLGDYERILVLRNFVKSEESHTVYRLTEIPKNLLMLGCDVKPEHIKLGRGRSGGGTFEFYEYEGHQRERGPRNSYPFLRIKLDANDEKITLQILELQEFIHGEWNIPAGIPPTVKEDPDQ